MIQCRNGNYNVLTQATRNGVTERDKTTYR